MEKTLTILLLTLYFGSTTGQQSSALPFIPDDIKRVVLMQPTGDMVENLPEMRIVEDTLSLYREVLDNIHNSFVNDFIDMYFIAQVYLKNMGKWDTIEPAYLALTTNQGGFAKFGFSLIQNERHITKPNAPYIDITVSQATSSQDRLMSFTQLYPHEMGHVLLHLLSPEDSTSNNTKNVDMHFFSIVTDFSTAFNEGFAEHIENVSRTYETNDFIKEGILNDIERIEEESVKSLKGFERDFIYPFRLGYYKASMLNWYQKYEDYKRHAHAFSGDIRYKNKSIDLSSTEDQLTFRNAGVGLNREARRNLVQLCATEGAVSAFFTHLTTSDLKNRYLASEFYRPFLDSFYIDTLPSPKRVFTPLQNQFIKYFYVFHNEVTFNNSDKSQLTDFIDGYIKAFPQEEEALKNVFKKSLGIEYSNEIPLPLWILVEDHPHRLLVFDPFDAITVPIYTFDLNAAEKEDLQTIPGVSSIVAQQIIDYRNKNGFFTHLDQVKDIQEIPKEVSDKIVASQLSENYFEQALNGFDQNLSISALIVSPLKYIFFRANIYFILFFGILYLSNIKRSRPTTKTLVGLLVKYLLLFNFIVLLGLGSILFSGGATHLAILTTFLLLTLVTIFIYRNRKISLLRSLTFLVMTALLLFMSLI